jgi:hypothetical protein
LSGLRSSVGCCRIRIRSDLRQLLDLLLAQRCNELRLRAPICRLREFDLLEWNRDRLFTDTQESTDIDQGSASLPIILEDEIGDLTVSVIKVFETESGVI